jgi:regulatory protein
MNEPLNQKVLAKLMRYCAFQERSSKEVLIKIRTNNVEEFQSKLIYDYLIQHNYLNDQRYASAFVSGKFRINKWGKIKIKMTLFNKGIDVKLIEKSIGEINQTEYLKTLQALAISKIEHINAKNAFDLKNKTRRYLLNKGYEADLINQTIESINMD